jgi:diguanylate cyclase (GGDEF)-like protein
MTSLRLSARLFIAGLFALVSILLVSVPGGDEWRAADILLALALAGLVAAAYRFPIEVAFKTVLVLDTSVIIAAALVFDPRAAMLIAGAGTLLAHLARRGGWDVAETVFNTLQAMLQAAAAGLILHGVGWETGALDFTRPSAVVALVSVTAVMYLVTTISVAVIVALQSGMSPLRVWNESRTPLDTVEVLAQLAFGLLVAIVVDARPWAVVLLVAPGLMLGVLFSGHLRRVRHELDEGIFALADAVDERDEYTLGHARRVAEYARRLALALELPREEVDLIERAARVHDIGRLTIEESTAQGGGADQLALVRRSPVVGAEMLQRIPRFALTADLVRYHLERVDGSGYPEGLTNEQIPIGARIIAVADAVDAMAAGRRYRPALKPDEILAELARGHGRQWDARVTDVMLVLLASDQLALAEAGQQAEAAGAGSPLSRSEPAPSSKPAVAPAGRFARADAAVLSLAVIGVALAFALAGPARAALNAGAASLLPVTLAGVIGIAAVLGFNWRRARHEAAQRRETEGELKHRAYHDALTGLANRALFLSRLEQALVRTRQRGERTAVLYLDMDNFKAVNESFGHAAGDTLLAVVAARLREAVRLGDTPARIGGDEFAAILEQVEDEAEALRVAERVAAAVREPLVVEGARITLTVSVGVAVAGSGHNAAPIDAGSLLRQADAALFNAKHAGKDRAEPARAPAPIPATVTASV